MRKLATGNVIAVLCLVCACRHAPAQQGQPDTVLLNGKIFTGVASRPYVEALAIRGERIAATGDSKTIQAMAGAKTKTIDLHGATVIPGINDAHHHFQLGPPRSTSISQRQTRSGPRSRMASWLPSPRTLPTA